MMQSHAEPEDISIVMPVYNHEATLVDAIESALMQEMPYRSVIYCFDDASTDLSSKILREYADKYPENIKVYTNPRNLGCGKASYLYHRPPIKGRYWCLFAGDDFWVTRDKLVRQINFLDTHSEYVGCSCDSLMKNLMTGEESIIKPCKNDWNLLDLLLLKDKYRFYVHTTSLIWRNIYLDQGFFLPPTYQKKDAFGDVVLMHVMLGRGGLVHNISEVMSCYQVTGRGIWSRRTLQEQDAMNSRLPEVIVRAIPFKYRLYLYLQKYTGMSKILKNFIPGPVNE